MIAAPGSTEPMISDWHCRTLTELAATVRSTDPGRTRIVAVDGRSAGGKTTLAERLHDAIANSAVLHTDDVAWNHSMFDWADLLADNIIRPVRQRSAVSYRPPGWAAGDRPGSIELPGGLDTLVIEGVGAGRRALAPLVDVLIWVQSDFETAHQRGIARDVASGVNGDPDESRRFWDRWMAAELPFLEEEQPWSRAELLVAGTEVPGCSERGRLAVHPAVGAGQ